MTGKIFYLSENPRPGETQNVPELAIRLEGCCRFPKALHGAPSQEQELCTQNSCPVGLSSVHILTASTEYMMESLLPKLICPSSNTQYLRMLLYLDRTFKGAVKVK